MALMFYLRAVRAHWLVALGVFAMCSVTTGLYVSVQSPIYTAKIQLFVATSSEGASATQLYEASNFSVERVKSYVRIINSPDVMQAVVNQLRLDQTAEQLAGSVNASTPVDTVLIDVSVTDRSPRGAQEIANAIGAQFPAVVGRIETPNGGQISPVKVSVTRSASLPAAPSSPRKKVDLLLGVLVGLALGVGTAVVRYRVDRRVRTEAEVSRIVRAPVIGALANDRRINERAPAVDQLSGSIAEELRRLRTNIGFLSIDRKLSSFVITSALASEGKSLIAGNLAIMMARAGERVVLVDGDLRRPRLAEAFSLPGSVGLTSVLVGNVPISRALRQWRDDIPLYLLPSGPIPPNPSELLSSTQFAEIVGELVNSGFVVVFDSPPLLPVTDAALIGRVTGGVLLVAQMKKVRSEQLASASQTLRAAGVNILGVIANRVTKSERVYGYDSIPDSVSAHQTTRRPAYDVVRHDDGLDLATTIIERKPSPERFPSS